MEAIENGQKGTVFKNEKETPGSPGKMRRNNWLRLVGIVCVILALTVNLAGCESTPKMTPEGEAIVETLVNEASVWESNTIWIMNFAKSDGKPVLFVYWYEGGSRDLTKTQKFWYSTSSPVQLVASSDIQLTAMYRNDGQNRFSSCWNTGWSREKKIEELTKLYIEFLKK